MNQYQKLLDLIFMVLIQNSLLNNWYRFWEIYSTGTKNYKSFYFDVPKGKEKQSKNKSISKVKYALGSRFQ